MTIQYTFVIILGWPGIIHFCPIGITKDSHNNPTNNLAQHMKTLLLPT